MERDATKQELAKARGMSLVVVPCWWDGAKESLVASIREIRPDLLQGAEGSGPDHKPISLQMPPNFLDKQALPAIEGIGQPVTACLFTMSDIDPTGWYPPPYNCFLIKTQIILNYSLPPPLRRWVFEKYDGVRAFWNPITRSFYSRFGKKFDIFPQNVIDAMPTDIFLDGELWYILFSLFLL